MDDMLKDFVVEALDLASNVEQHLLSLEKNPDDKETLNAVFRSFHTIKGGAGFMALPAMVAACHLTENLFDGLRTGAVAVTPTAIEAALQASGFVADQLTQLANGATSEELAAMPAALEEILTLAIAGGVPDPTPPADKAVPVESTAPTDAPANSDGARGEISSSDTALNANGINWEAYYYAIVPAPEKLVEPGHLVSTIVDDVAEVAGTIEANSAAPVAAPLAAAKPATAPAWDGNDRRGTAGAGVATPIKEDSIRVDSSKLDDLLEIAGESVQAANQGAALIEKMLQFKIEDEKLASLMAALSETVNRGARYSAELQKASLATRMQPIGRLFQKFPRLVRELAKELGKDIELVIEGADTEVDRVVVESLYDPLVHMLRNALDHGIETPDQRQAAGKPAKAIVSLSAWQAANSVMIELSDDGKGMDAGVLRAKALAKGLIGPDDAHSNEQAYQLVFLPGFSTKEVASAVSGRGVGMDVVKTAVEKNRGIITIDSTLGKGTCFSIRLPIELSIVPTMLVSTSGASLGIPLALVQRVVQIPETLASISGEPILVDQGVALPVRSLGGVLGYAPGNARTDEPVGLVMAVKSPYILAVGAVDGTFDLVIKPLTAYRAQGVTGTARSAEGHMVLVVDPGFIESGCKAA